MLSPFTNVSTKKKIANLLFPRYSLALDQINNNAALKKWIGEIPKSVPVCAGRLEFETLLFEKYVSAGPINYVEFGRCLYVQTIADTHLTDRPCRQNPRRRHRPPVRPDRVCHRPRRRWHICNRNDRHP